MIHETSLVIYLGYIRCILRVIVESEITSRSDNKGK